MWGRQGWTLTSLPGQACRWAREVGTWAELGLAEPAGESDEGFNALAGPNRQGGPEHRSELKAAYLLGAPTRCQAEPNLLSSITIHLELARHLSQILFGAKLISRRKGSLRGRLWLRGAAMLSRLRTSRNPAVTPGLVALQGGKMFLLNRRVVNLSAEGFGLLRKDLISVLGIEGARNFFTRYGWNCGYHDAISIKETFPGIDRQEWYSYGARLHSMYGIVNVKMHVSMYDPESQTCYFEGEWEDSFEAEQHLKHFGQSREVACWSLAGYASGYKSAVLGRQVLCTEVQCLARGDPSCRFVGKTLPEWGQEPIGELKYYEELRFLEELCALYRELNDNKWVRESLAIQRSLTHLYLNGNSLTAILDKLAQLTATTVALISPAFEVLYCSSAAGLRWLGTWLGDHKHLMSTKENKTIVVKPEGKGDTTYSLISPVFAGTKDRGWVALFRANPYKETEIALVEHAALICSAVLGCRMLRNIDRQELCERLVNGGIYDLALVPAEISSALGLHEGEVYTAIVIEAGNMGKLLFELEQEVGLAPVKLLSQDNLCYAILPDRQLSAIHNTTGKVDGILKKNGAYLSMGSSVSELRQLPISFEEAKHALQVLKTFNRQGGILCHKDIEGYRFLLEADKSLKERFVGSILAPLIAYDRQKGADLLRTLEVYLSTGSIQATAWTCNLHPSGVKYRLRKIEELIGRNITDSRTRFDLQMALLVSKM